jgi:hypothetical protein
MKIAKKLNMFRKPGNAVMIGFFLILMLKFCPSFENFKQIINT